MTLRVALKIKGRCEPLVIEAEEILSADVVPSRYAYVRYVGKGFDTKDYKYEDGIGNLAVGDFVFAGVNHAPAIVVSVGVGGGGLRHTVPITERWTVAELENRLR